MMTMTEVFNNIKVNNTYKNIPIASMYCENEILLVEMNIKFMSPEDKIIISRHKMDGKWFYQDWIWNEEDHCFDHLSDGDREDNPKEIWKSHNFIAECPKCLRTDKLLDESFMDAFLWKYDCPEYAMKKREDEEY